MCYNNDRLKNEVVKLEKNIESLILQCELEYNNLMTRLINTIKSGNENYTNLQQFIEQLFIINELKAFLKYELENVKIELDTKLTEKNYEILSLRHDFIDSFMGVYYNSDLGTSYNDIVIILKEIIMEVE